MPEMGGVSVLHKLVNWLILSHHLFWTSLCLSFKLKYALHYPSLVLQHAKRRPGKFSGCFSGEDLSPIPLAYGPGAVRVQLIYSSLFTIII